MSEQLRREIERLMSVAGDHTESLGEQGRGPFISRAAVLAIVDRLAPTAESGALDVERLTKALLNVQEFGEHNAACLDTTCPVAAELADLAPVLAREYAVLGSDQ